jgi:hypothetical protein
MYYESTLVQVVQKSSSTSNSSDSHTVLHTLWSEQTTSKQIGLVTIIGHMISVSSVKYYTYRIVNRKLFVGIHSDQNGSSIGLEKKRKGLRSLHF